MAILFIVDTTARNQSVIVDKRTADESNIAVSRIIYPAAMFICYVVLKCTIDQSGTTSMVAQSRYN